MIAGRAPAGLYRDADFREGLARLGKVATVIERQVRVMAQLRSQG